MLQEWNDTLPLIFARLKSSCVAHDAHDVHQNTWITANAHLESFNPETGCFRSWIRAVARTECLIFMRQQSIKAKQEENLVQQAEAGIGLELLALMEPDMAEEIVNDQGNYARLDQVLSMLMSIMDNPQHLMRTLKIILAFEGNVAAASRVLGVPVKTLRDNQAHTVRLAQVIDQALDLYQQRQELETDAPVSVDELLGCLPDAEVNRLPEAFEVLASLIAGGSQLEPSAIGVLGQQLWISYSMGRNYYNQLIQMLSVAKAVAEDGFGLVCR